MGFEHQAVKGVVQSINIITREASLRVAEYAFHYAKTQERKKVSAVHKTNVMQKTNGLFLECCQEVASKYPDILYAEVVVENCCMMLVNNVLVMPSFYGDIINNLCAGFCSIGKDGVALAEVVHDSMHDLAGKNLANPTAMLLSGVMMLRHLELNEKAEQIHKAIVNTIVEGKHRTVDLGGTSTTTEFTNAICDHLLNQ
ncbi:hypothetical protein Bca52824_021237 [Brassica carinata]|uniref:Isopropylmalate dehydrogenase-like domain-containing protein n=1 Tax=Brassica carinata TaxID=52824 RepID=A0A8X8B0F2_BRACI|nr:hypothetical protein Bca52824_021237 [Brassica carinata]